MGSSPDRSSDLPGMRHVIANVLVRADGDVVTGAAYFVCFRLGGDGQFRIRNFGRYEDTFARHGDGWRIATRDVVSELPVDLVDAPFAFAAGQTGVSAGSARQPGSSALLDLDRAGGAVAHRLSRECDLLARR